ncbi:glycosyltransferase family 4 protein [Methanofollis fontis]|uniref:Glycosyltransferase family 1 protein n=1 Tax=Methanofollis fontis TaxID=2052832 RepID=A0A483CRS9_9EURY|nr:glycosyltransferase family 4 protein [Methanofollis fontis]TAJ43684.1 glycosyltransferase family 1 protein [Methanofollis fontis]
MKILRVVSDLYPSVVGGVGLHAHEMSRLQARAGHEVTVITYRTDSQQLSSEEGDGYQIFRLNAPIKIFGNSISFSLFQRLLKNFNSYDVVHAHSHLFFSTLLCTLVHRFRSTPLVVTNHGLVSQTAPAWLQRIYIPTVGKWIFQSADAIICYTETERSQLIDLGVPSSKIHVIHNGIETDVFIPSISCSPKKQILWIGRFTPGKGVEYLLKGFQIFSREYPDYSLMMIGRGPLKDEFIDMIKEMELGDKVTLQDFIPNHELPGLYQDSSFFVLPSLEEGVPRTILEGMACGKPVVCTELPQLVDIVSGCGMLVPLRDSEALADALSRLAEDPHLASSIGKAGRVNVVSHFSWEDTVSRTLDLYDSLISSRSLGRPVSGDCDRTGALEKISGSPDSERIGRSL